MATWRSTLLALLSSCALFIAGAERPSRQGSVSQDLKLDKKSEGWPFDNMPHFLPLQIMWDAPPPSPPRIDIYIINRADRTDRLSCMNNQLKAPPNNIRVLRHDATPDNTCPFLPDSDVLLDNKVGKRNLFCNRFLIMNKALAEHADYSIILEDDAILSVSFFDGINKYLTDGCNDFDIITVDPFLDRDGVVVFDQWWADNSEDVDGCSNTYALAKKGQPVWFGAHMQIIKQDFVPTWIEQAQKHGVGNSDHWWQTYLTPDFRAYGAALGIATQWTDADGLAQRNCSSTVFDSDLRELTTSWPAVSDNARPSADVALNISTTSSPKQDTTTPTAMDA